MVLNGLICETMMLFMQSSIIVGNYISTPIIHRAVKLGFGSLHAEVVWGNKLYIVNIF